MDLLVVSPESEYANEAELIVRLFDAGLCRYHLRKPAWSMEQCAALLQEIPAAYHARISTHQYHRLIEMFEVGVHFKEAVVHASAGDAEPRVIGGYVPECVPQIKSRSLHGIQNLRMHLRGIDYAFLSPIFPSISKENYSPTWSESELCAALKPSFAAKVYALGGITPTHVGCALKYGFDGVVLHGVLWQAAEPLTIFEAVGKKVAT